MTGRGPDFHDLVGAELGAEEEARLRRVHDLLLQAGPPPEVPPALATPALESPRSRLLPRRRRGAALLLAAALAAAAFGVGYLVGDRNEGVKAFESTQVVRLHGTSRAPRALATVQVGKPDKSGNLPMLVTAQGLKRLGPSGYYTLALTKNGRPVVTCGTFRIGPGGVSTVRMAVAYDVNRFDGWVITEYKHGRKAEPVMLTS
jgi:Anti-sigma-K factor rskA